MIKKKIHIENEQDKITDEQNSGEFKFINERVVKNNNGFIKILLFLVACGIIIGIVACFDFSWAEPYIGRALGNDADEETKEVIQSSPFESTTETENITTQDAEERIDVMEKKVLTLCKNEEEDWTSTETDHNKYSSGVIISTGSKLKVLTNYSFVKDERGILVYIGEKRCRGTAAQVSKEYGLAIINVNTSNLSDEEIEDLKSATFVSDIDYNVGNEVTFIGNPYGKEKFIANGSLTSVGNTYNIVDTELKIVTTDISSTELMNGFVFDENGKLIGMVNDITNDSKVGDNLISFISINEIATYIEKLVSDNQITYLGIIAKEVTNEVVENIDKDMPYGIYISYTEEKSPAYTAGIMNGDIIVKIDDKSVLNFEKFTSLLQKYQVDDEVIIEVMRKGKDGYKEIKYTVKIGGR